MIDKTKTWYSAEGYVVMPSYIKTSQSYDSYDEIDITGIIQKSDVRIVTNPNALIIEDDLKILLIENILKDEQERKERILEGKNA